MLQQVEFNRDLQTLESCLGQQSGRKLQQEGPYPENGKIPAIQVNSFLQSDQDAKQPPDMWLPQRTIILGTTALQ